MWKKYKIVIIILIVAVVLTASYFLYNKLKPKTFKDSVDALVAANPGMDQFSAIEQLAIANGTITKVEGDNAILFIKRYGDGPDKFIEYVTLRSTGKNHTDVMNTFYPSIDQDNESGS